MNKFEEGFEEGVVMGSGARHRGLSLVILVGSLAVTLVGPAGCDTSQYAFRVDESIDIEAPEARSDVDLPVTVRWADETPPAGLRVDPTDPDAAYYAVFVDRAPLRPGTSLSSLAEDRDGCAGQPTCPDETVLRERGVLLTAAREVTLEFLADGRVNDGSKDQHDVTVVRMRGAERSGEAAWDQTFFVNR